MHDFHRLLAHRTGLRSLRPPSDTPLYDAVVADLGSPLTDWPAPAELVFIWGQHLEHLPR